MYYKYGTFNSLGYGKNKPLPKISALKQEWATLEAQKKKLYKNYYALRDQSRELAVAKGNCERILGIDKNATGNANERTADHASDHPRRRSTTHEL